MSLTGLAFLLFFASFCWLALSRHPIYGLMIYISVFYLHPPSRWWGETLPDLRWSFSTAALTLVAVLIHSRKAAKPQRHVLSHGVMKGIPIFVLWLAVQMLWAMERDMQIVLLSAYAKYFVLMLLIYACIETVEHLRMVLWTHVAGCFYLGWIALTDHTGGRFEGFGGPDINEANSGALQIVTGIVVSGALFLVGRFRSRIAVLLSAPLIVNALIVTVSRSGFLAAAVAGFIFNTLTAARYKRFVKIASVLGIVLFVLLTNPQYWARMASIKLAGQQVEGVDTGAGRKEIIFAQLEMFKAHPFGCGHRCTATLSPQYLDDRFLTGQGSERQRASHNTIMSLLVEQGAPGVILYALLVGWTFRTVMKLREIMRRNEGLAGQAYAAIAASLAAIFVGDLFVDYLKFEARIWFLALLMVVVKLAGETNPQGSGYSRDGLDRKPRPAMRNASRGPLPR